MVVTVRDTVQYRDVHYTDSVGTTVEENSGVFCPNPNIYDSCQ